MLLEAKGRRGDPGMEKGLLTVKVFQERPCVGQLGLRFQTGKNLVAPVSGQHQAGGLHAASQALEKIHEKGHAQIVHSLLHGKELVIKVWGFGTQGQLFVLTTQGLGDLAGDQAIICGCAVRVLIGEGLVVYPGPGKRRNYSPGIESAAQGQTNFILRPVSLNHFQESVHQLPQSLGFGSVAKRLPKSKLGAVAHSQLVIVPVVNGDRGAFERVDLIEAAAPSGNIAEDLIEGQVERVGTR